MDHNKLWKILKEMGIPDHLVWIGNYLVAHTAKNLPAMWDPGSVPGSGRSPGKGHGNSLQYSCLENPMDRGAWRATFHGVTKSGIRLGN